MWKWVIVDFIASKLKIFISILLFGYMKRIRCVSALIHSKGHRLRYFKRRLRSTGLEIETSFIFSASELFYHCLWVMREFTDTSWFIPATSFSIFDTMLPFIKLNLIAFKFFCHGSILELTVFSLNNDHLLFMHRHFLMLATSLRLTHFFMLFYYYVIDCSYKVLINWLVIICFNSYKFIFKQINFKSIKY